MPNLSWLELLVAALAAWRLAYMLVREVGPGNIFLRLRQVRQLNGLLVCVYCVSVWTAALMLVLMLTPLAALVWWLAISGAGLMLASFSGVEYKP